MSQPGSGYPSDGFSGAALGLAKWVARQESSDVLQAMHFVLGFAIAVATKAAEPPEDFLPFAEDFKFALEQSDALKPGVTPVAGSEKMPLSEEAAGLIKKCGGKLDRLLEELGKIAKVPVVFRGAAFGPFLLRASDVARAAGASRLGADHLVAAAYFAFVEGALKDKPSLSAFVSANLRPIERLIAERGWRSLGGGEGGKGLLPLDQALVSDCVGIDEARNPLIAAFNQGVRIGAGFLSKERVAYHEAGHAIVSYTLRPELTVTHVTIVDSKVSDGGVADGVTYYDGSSPYWDRFRREDFLVSARVFMAGRLAEQIKFGEDQCDAGALSDIERATEAAWNAVGVYGLDDDIGPVNLPILGRSMGIAGGPLFDKAQERVQTVLKDAARDARNILEANWPKVEVLAQALIARKSLNDDDLIASLLSAGISRMPGVVRARSRSIERSVSFATSDGVHTTPEGPVRYQAGDAIVTGEIGETWPVSRGVFAASYGPVGDVVMGQPGRYLKQPKDVLAVQIRSQGRIDLSDGRGLHTGKKGDWIVDYGNNDLAIVSDAVFERTYEVLAGGV